MRPRTVRLMDAALVVWVLAWIALGVAIGVETQRLTDLSNTVASDGRAIVAVSKSLSKLADLPLVGGTLGHADARVRQAGQSAIASGESSRSAIGTLSYLLAIAVALLPSVPVLAVYLPWRLGRKRRARALRAAVRAELVRLGAGDEPPPTSRPK